MGKMTKKGGNKIKKGIRFIKSPKKGWRLLLWSTKDEKFVTIDYDKFKKEIEKLIEDLNKEKTKRPGN